MNKSIIILFSSVVVLFLACGPATDKEHQHGAESTAHTSKYTSPDGHTIGINVALNNGAKWEANIETTKGIGAMSGMLGEFPPNPTLEDYRALNKKLATQFQSILQQCTMTGEAHQQLHNYLMPLKEMIDTFGSGSLEDCNKIRPEMKEYLVKYSHFFYT